MDGMTLLIYRRTMVGILWAFLASVISYGMNSGHKRTSVEAGFDTDVVTAAAVALLQDSVGAALLAEHKKLMCDATQIVARKTLNNIKSAYAAWLISATSVLQTN